MNLKLFLILSVLIALMRAQTINTYYTTTQTGQGTYYGATTAGNCAIYRNGWPTFITQNPNIINVALNTPQYADSLPCGMCLNMTGSGVGSGANPIVGTFTVYITDSCPSCSSPNLDLAKSGDGLWNIQWNAIDCPVGNNKITYIFEGSNNYYIKIQPRGARQPIKDFYANVGGSYQQLTRTNDNFFQKSFSTQLSFPLSVRMVNIFGQQLDDVVPNLDNTAVIAGNNGVQFNPSSSPTTQAPTTQAPTTQAPTTQAPTTQAPTTQAPTTQAPTTQAPTTQAPTTSSPTTQAPTTKAPTTSPTTQAPTTQSPTTSPTTQAPTTKAPTTPSPTTQAPATPSPTTPSPTTPTTSPTTPTTSPSTTAPPTKTPTKTNSSLSLSFSLFFLFFLVFIYFF